MTLITTTPRALPIVAGLACCAGASAAPIQVIYTKIPGHPSAAVPGARDLAGMPAATDFRAFEDLVISPDGSQWIVKGRTQQGADLETILIRGGGLAGSAFAQEGQPIIGGAPGELYDFFGSGLGRFDELGRFAFSARARGGLASTAQKVILWDGATFTVPNQMGNLWTGLIDQSPNPSGDETVGNSVGSVHLLNDGRIGSQDSSIGNIHTSRRPAIFYNNAAFHQSNVTTVTGLAGPPSVETWKSIDANAFYTTPDGAHWIALGTVNQPTTSDAVLVADGQVVLQENVTSADGAVTPTTIVNVHLAASGDYFARGATVGGVYARRNADTLAITGGPITAGAAEVWGASFLAFSGNSVGDWVLAGVTVNANLGADNVLVMNGGRVLVREGDPVDLNGNGMFDDDVFIGRGNNTLSAFEPNDAFIDDNQNVYFFANLRDGAGNDLNSNPAFGAPQSFLRVRGACPGDANHDGVVTFADLNLVLSNFGATGRPGFIGGDVNRDGVVNFNDLNLVLSFFGGPAC